MYSPFNSQGFTCLSNAWSYALSIISLISSGEVSLVVSNILCNYLGFTISEATGKSIGIGSLLHQEPVYLNVLTFWFGY